MNKTKQPANPAPQPPAPPASNLQEGFESEELWQQLQAAWDKHTRHIDETIARSDRPLLRIDTETLKATKRRIRIAYTAIVIFCTVIAVIAAIAVIRQPDSVLRTLYCIGVAVVIAVVCLLSFGTRSPKDKPRPLDALPASNGDAIPPPIDTALLLDALATQHRYSVLKSSSPKSLASILAATTVLVFAACTPAGNECKITSADTAERIETIAIIDTIIANNTQS